MDHESSWMAANAIAHSARMSQVSIDSGVADIVHAVKVAIGDQSFSRLILTKRELFAAMAMQGLIFCSTGAEYDPEIVAQSACIHADALLAELEKGEKP